MGVNGPLLVTTLADARAVLAAAADFVIPFDVSRERVRNDHTVKHTAPLTRAAVARGLAVLAEELADCSRTVSTSHVSALHLLRDPLARSSVAALVPESDLRQRNEVAALVLDWVDSLAPVISASRPPRPWSRHRRVEARARRSLSTALSGLSCDAPSARATALAAGVQVPVAAAAWTLTQLACRPQLQSQLRENEALVDGVVWEVLRMFPPTWLLPRVTTREVTIGTSAVPAYASVLVSPWALGRLADLAPGPSVGSAPLDEFDPGRWHPITQQPGAWLPFGAGVHACPGRSLGLGQLRAVTKWAAGFDLESPRPPRIDTSRGLVPDPPDILIAPRSAAGR